jgi:hypothetical protein
VEQVVAPVSPDDTPRKYTTDGCDKELRQGEIISDLVLYQYDPIIDKVLKSQVPYCVILLGL